MRYRYNSLFLFALFFQVNAFVGLKKNKTPKFKVGDIKQSIGDIFEKMLTSSTHLIASLSEEIEVIAKNIKDLISSNDAFFSQKNGLSLQQYLEKIEQLHNEQKKFEMYLKKELKKLKNNFN